MTTWRQPSQPVRRLKLFRNYFVFRSSVCCDVFHHFGCIIEARGQSRHEASRKRPFFWFCFLVSSRTCCSFRSLPASSSFCSVTSRAKRDGWIALVLPLWYIFCTYHLTSLRFFCCCCWFCWRFTGLRWSDLSARAHAIWPNAVVSTS